MRGDYRESVLQWCCMEPNEKGRYDIDPRADRAITETVKNGANIITALDYGNWLYDSGRHPEVTRPGIGWNGTASGWFAAGPEMGAPE